MTETTNEIGNDSQEKEIKKLKKKLKKRELEINSIKEKNIEHDKHSQLMIEYKGQAYNALYNTAMEKDKSLLTISVAALGFIATIYKKEIDVIFLYLSAASSILFLICIYTIIKIFKLNQDLLVSNVRDEEGLTDFLAKKLDREDKIASFTFYSGLMLATILGFFS